MGLGPSVASPTHTRSPVSPVASPTSDVTFSSLSADPGVNFRRLVAAGIRSIASPCQLTASHLLDADSTPITLSSTASTRYFSTIGEIVCDPVNAVLWLPAVESKCDGLIMPSSVQLAKQPIVVYLATLKNPYGPDSLETAGRMAQFAAVLELMRQSDLSGASVIPVVIWNGSADQRVPLDQKTVKQFRNRVESVLVFDGSVCDMLGVRTGDGPEARTVSLSIWQQRKHLLADSSMDGPDDDYYAGDWNSLLASKSFHRMTKP